jgi:hypothetical protein
VAAPPQGLDDARHLEAAFDVQQAEVVLGHGGSRPALTPAGLPKRPIGIAELALDQGFTAAVGAGAAKTRLDIVVRDEIKRGRDMADKETWQAKQDARLTEREGMEGTAENAAKIKREAEVGLINKQRDLQTLRDKGALETDTGFTSRGEDGLIRSTVEAESLLALTYRTRCWLWEAPRSC